VSVAAVRPSRVSGASLCGTVAPPCLSCQHTALVRPLALHDLAPGIQYWSCSACGYVWATHDSLRAALA
jgi:hypothetical protein